MAGGGAPGTQNLASTMTDLMTSLAVIFILLLVVFLKQSHDQSKRSKEDLMKHLEEVLKQKSLQLKQDAEDPLTLAVMVGESQLQFPVGSSALSGASGEFTESFFRNFATQICQPALRQHVDSVVIEGHTDTSGERTPEGVSRNIMLSQQRSFSVMERALRSVQNDPPTHECFLKLASATGKGSRSPVSGADGQYSADLSRRVEVKIRVRSAEQQFRAIVNKLGK